MKVVINNCYGGFGLSPKAIKRYLELKGKECFFYDALRGYKIEEPSRHDLAMVYTKDFGEKAPERSYEYFFNDSDIPRNDNDLVRVVEELSGEANNRFSALKIVDIPDDVEFIIEEYDGNEWIAEKHRTWE